MGGTPDSDCQLGYRMRAELLFRPSMGGAGASAFPRQASRSAAQVRGGTKATSGNVFGDVAVVTKSLPQGTQRNTGDSSMSVALLCVPPCPSVLPVVRLCIPGRGWVSTAATLPV